LEGKSRVFVIFSDPAPPVCRVDDVTTTSITMSWEAIVGKVTIASGALFLTGPDLPDDLEKGPGSKSPVGSYVPTLIQP